jgi:hypothetical protein
MMQREPGIGRHNAQPLVDKGFFVIKRDRLFYAGPGPVAGGAGNDRVERTI